MLGGLSRQRVYQLSTSEGFPAPLAVLSTGKVWNHADVKSWAERQGRTVHPLAD